MVDASGIEAMDLTGAWLLHSLERQLRESGGRVEWTGGRPDKLEFIDRTETGKDKEQRSASAPPEGFGQSLPVQTPGPDEMSGRVVLFRPFLLEKRLGPPVADLLAPVGTDGVAAVMPDHGRRMKAERPAALLQPPADVDIIAGGAEARIEAADGLEGLSAEGHVASGNVLGHLIRE